MEGFLGSQKTAEKSRHFYSKTNPTPTQHPQHDTHFNIINLTSYQLTEDKSSVLQLGLGFCPLDALKVTETIKDLYLFVHNLTFKFIFDKQHAKRNLERELAECTKHFSMEEYRALRDLMLMYDEGAVEDSGPSPVVPLTAPQIITTPTRGPVSKPFRLRSCKFLDLITCPAIWAFVQATIRDLKQLLILTVVKLKHSNLYKDVLKL